MNLLNTVLRMTHVYLSSKSSIANVQIQNDCYKGSIIYERLDLLEDEYFINLGEYGNESYDFQICKSKIKSMGVRQGAIVISLLDNSEFVITIDTDCEVEDGEYILLPT